MYSQAFIMIRLYFFILFIFSIPAVACDPQYSLSSTINSNNSTLLGSSKTDFSAVITLKPVTLQGQPGWWAIKADQVAIKDNPHLIRETYELPFAFYINENGLIDRFWYPKYLNREQEITLNGFAHYFQLKQTEQQGEYSTETESNNRYLYQYNTDSTSNELVKVKIRKLSQKGAKKEASDYNILESENRFTLDNCFFSNASGNETIDVTSPISAFSASVTYQFSLQRTQVPIKTLLQDLPNELNDWPSFSENISTTELERQRKELVKVVTRFSATTTDVFTLVQQLEKNEAALASITDILAENKLAKTENMRLFNALGVMDSDNSQLLLLNIVNDSELDDSSRFRALQALTGGSNRLSDDVTNSINSLLIQGVNTEDPVLINSLLPSLGATISSRPDDHNTQSLLYTLENELSNEVTPQRKSHLLLAIGNIGSELLTDSVIESTNNDSAHVRSSAAYALGKIQTERSYQALGNMLNEESNDRVEQRIIESFKGYTLQDKEMQQILSISTASKNNQLRKQSIKTIIAQPKDTRTPALKALLQSETNRNNQKLIINAIHGN
ncbi:hypothetical protein BCU68_12375 [Vibrio sp. 10N.286.49.B3]|nr:hypothetical protein BCU68_12375 [Vibrio sp. 10N.286.49.B3]